MWVFGYGSLIWKADFTYKRKIVGYIRGYQRRFWQGSEDHRGVPGRPGRVVTLVEADNPQRTVWGVAYEIPVEYEESVRSHLDYREKGGYKPTVVTFHPQDTINHQAFDLTIYVGSKDNPYFLGNASATDIAKQIYQSTGASGKNSEYLFELANAMRRIAPNIVDEHLFELESLVKTLHASEEKGI